MRHGARLAGSLLAVTGLAGLLSGCPLEWQKESTQNSAPFTFFSFAPGDTTFQNQVSFGWLGTDLDSDVVAFQYQLVETDARYYFFGPDSGQVLRSIDPRSESTEVMWTPRATDNFQAFAGLTDGWYEMRARSIDDQGLESAPASTRFYVFFDDISPTVQLVPNPTNGLGPCGSISPFTSWTFYVDASDESRSGPVERRFLEYSYQLRAHRISACDTHVSDPFSEWQRFPETPGPVAIGDEPPDEYNDLNDQDCGWDFAVRVRDPAGNIVTTPPCCIASVVQVGCLD